MSNFQLSAVLQANIADFTAKMDQAIGKFKEVAKQPEQLGGKLKSVGGDMAAWGAKATLATAPIAAGFVGATKSAIDYESAFAGVKKVYDGTDKEFAALNDEIRQTSKVMPIAQNDLAGIVEMGGQLGIPKEMAMDFAKTIADISVSTNLTQEQAASDFAKFANIVGMPLDNIGNLGSSIVTMGNNFATTEADVTSMMMRIAAGGKQFGLTESQIVGLSTTLSSVGVSAEAGGSAVSTTMAKMRTAVLDGGDGLEKFAGIAGVTSKEFADAYQKDPMAAMQMFVDGMSGVVDEGGNLNAMLKDAGINGINEIDVLSRLAGGNDILRDAVSKAGQSYKENTALTDEAAQRYETTASKLQIFKNHLTDLGITMGNHIIPVLTKVVEFAQKWIDKFSGASEGVQKIILVLGALAVAIGPIITGLGIFLASIGGIITGATAFWGVLVKLGPVFNVVKTGLMALTGPIGIISAIVIALGILIYKNWDTIKAKTIEVWSSVSEWLSNAWSRITESASAIWSGLVGWFSGIWTSITSGISGFLSATAQKFTDGWNKAKEITQNVFNGISNFFSTWVVGLLAWTPIGMFVSFIAKNWDAIKKTTKIVFDMIASLVELAFVLIKKAVTPIVDGISKFISSAWNGIKSVTSTVFNAVSSVVKSVWNGIKSFLTPIINAIKNTISTAWNSVKNTTSTIFNAVKSVVSSVWNSIKSVVTSVATGIWNAVSTKFNAIKSTVTTIFNSVKTVASSVWNGIKSTITSVASSIFSTVSTKFNAVKSAITGPLETAKRTVLGIIDAIKGAFSRMKITIPKPKLPKINVSTGSKTIAGVSIPYPKFSVDWFAKGGIMTKPTAFGRNGNSVMAGGEAGKEAILPLNKRNLGYIANQMDRYRDKPEKTQQQQPIVLNFNIENMNAKDRKEAENVADVVASHFLKNLSKRGMGGSRF